MHRKMPRTGMTGIFPIVKGIRKGRETCGVRNRRAITAPLITMKVIKRVKLVTFATNAMSPEKTNTIERSEQRRIAARGVLLVACTIENHRGSTREPAIPYRIREEAYIDINTVFPVAKSAITDIRIAAPGPAVPAAISANGASDAPRSFQPRTETAEIATRT